MLDEKTALQIQEEKFKNSNVEGNWEEPEEEEEEEE